MRPRRNEERVEKLGLSIAPPRSATKSMVILLRPAWRCSTGITRWSGTIVGSIVFEPTRTLRTPLFGTKSNASGRAASFRTNVITTGRRPVDFLFDGDGEAQVVTHVADAVGAFFSEAERIPGLAQVLVTSRRVGTVA